MCLKTLKLRFYCYEIDSAVEEDAMFFSILLGGRKDD